MMLKYTHIHTHIITHHTGTCHLFSITANKILIHIYNKILNFDMQMFHCMTQPPKSFHPIAQRELIGQSGPKNIDNGDIKTQIPGHIP